MFACSLYYINALSELEGFDKFLHVFSSPRNLLHQCTIRLSIYIINVYGGYKLQENTPIFITLSLLSLTTEHEIYKNSYIFLFSFLWSARAKVGGIIEAIWTYISFLKIVKSAIAVFGIDFPRGNSNVSGLTNLLFFLIL